MSSLVKCPPFCRTNCAIKHHPLLVALLNCADNPDESEMKNRVADLKHVVSIYKEHKDWDITSVIPDAMEGYRLTLGHWACGLGRVEAMKWLVQNGYPPSFVCSTTGYTCLHYAILKLLETCPYLASKKFEDLLTTAREALSSKDVFGNTVLHLCCDMLQRSMPRKDYFTDAIEAICQLVRTYSSDERASILDARNQEGDTALHILAKGCSHLQGCARHLVDCGANVEIPNDEGFTPIELAVKNRKTQMAMFFDSVLREKGKTHKLASYMEKMRNQKVVCVDKVARGKNIEKASVRPKEEILKDLEKMLGITDVINIDEDEQNSMGDGNSEGPSIKRSRTTSTSKPGETENKKDAENQGSDDPNEPIVINMQIPHLQVAGQGVSEPAVMSISITDGGDALEGFLEKCEAGLKNHILAAVLKAQDECTKSLEVIGDKQHEITEKIKMQTKEQDSSLFLIQTMMDHLQRLQTEEHTLRKQLSVTQRKMGSLAFTVKGLQERVSHCQSALDALNSDN